MPEFSQIFSAIEPWIADYGVAVVFVILTLESFGMPLPGESLLIVASIMAGRGSLSFSALLVAAWAGAVAGDNIGYWIGRSLGQRLASGYGRKIGLTKARLSRVEAVFAKYGPVTVAFARFFNVLRQLNGVVAGTLEMPWWQFLIFNALGAALWVGAWSGAAYYFGLHSSDLMTLAYRFGILGGVAAIAALAIFLIYRWRTRRKHRRGR
jgi:membrane protein DedA with SNARE-associated domain